MNRHFNVVEGFECWNDPRGYVVQGLNAPGRVSHGKQALGYGSDKERFRRLRKDHITSPAKAEPGSYPGARPGVGTCQQALVAGLLLVGPGRAKPARKTHGHPPVGPPPAGGTIRDWCKEDREADEGGDFDDPISGCLNWL
ncbi:hypothetical protein CHARACLAT_024365 [Characodon lateralis]|uniref:MHC class I antigen n=1 Tax=Characodon lateralis TaxID=208331 RepID=A0ABU7DXT6_9TELE|nr:hypothetical protein [Characodon lateralis]